jgi:hypothetical protein
MPHSKTKKQVAYLMSSGSPLKPAQKETLRAELHSGRVRVIAKKRTGKSA